MVLFSQTVWGALLLLCRRFPLCFELAPVLYAGHPVGVRVKRAWTPLMLVCQVAKCLHDGKLYLSVGVVQSREERIQSGLRIRVFESASRANSRLGLRQFQRPGE